MAGDVLSAVAPVVGSCTGFRLSDWQRFVMAPSPVRSMTVASWASSVSGLG